MTKESRQKTPSVSKKKKANGVSPQNQAADVIESGSEVASDLLSCTSDTSLTRDQMLELYHYLKLTRLVEERLVNLYRQTKIVGGVFRSLGQEATAVGTAYALQPQDFITPLIRDLGAVLELQCIGRADGCCFLTKRPEY